MISLAADKYDKGSTERFGYEWSRYSEIIPEYEEQFLKWVYPFIKEDFAGKIILDAGCGTGRNSYWPLVYGAEKVVAFDYDQNTVSVAQKNLSHFLNFEVFYKSIYDIDYKDVFDMVFSIGVIHHLDKPRQAVQALVRAAKDNGIVLIWVYGYEGNEWIVRYINPIRKVVSRLPLFFAHLISYGLSVPLYAYLKLFNHKRPYFKQLSGFKFWHVHSIVFDQLIPKIANYWTKEEALGLFKNQGLKDIKAYRVNNNSWTIIGIKDSFLR